jgi:DNA-binding transcriptional MerR regulator
VTVTHLPTHDVDLPPGAVTSVDLCYRAGITYRQLDYWARTGLLEPTIRPATGSGTQRLYSTHGLHRAATIRWLLDAGIALQTIRQVIDELLESGSVRLVDGLVIHLPEDI